MPVTIDGTSGITTPDLESAGQVTSNGLTTSLYPLISGTAVASTSGTSIDFTGIPSWVKRITVMLSGVSVSGTSIPLFQLGDSGGIENTGYVVTASVSVSGTAETTSTAGFLLYTNNASNTIRGAIVFYLIDSATNSWVGNGTFGTQGGVNTCIMLGGSKSLSATLDRVRITTVNGTDTFDAGSINILYE
jgi:hypothetical protein